LPKDVTVSGANDGDGPGQPYTIRIGPASGGGYDAVDPADLAFTNDDGGGV
jgi:hypothetical protein